MFKGYYLIEAFAAGLKQQGTTVLYSFEGFPIVFTRPGPRRGLQKKSHPRYEIFSKTIE